MQLSVIVPFHRNLAQLRRCLAALKVAERALRDGVELREVVVVADGATEDPKQVTIETGATLLAIAGPSGPASARNRGAAITSGDVLVFVDSDVVISEEALARLAGLFASQADLGAAFGAYDEEPADPGFISQCKNLAHSFVHQQARGDARTFWAGLGAVRADVFAVVGGFDERFGRPSVEDIDLGYRIRRANRRILLDPSILGKHLKRWTLPSAIVTDARDRGVPWTQLLHRYDGLHNDLNITIAQRACVVIAYLLVGSLVGALRWPVLLAAVPVATAALWLIDRRSYRFFVARRGLLWALGWFPVQTLQHLSNGVSFAVGTLLAFAQRWTGIALPGALPLTPWIGRHAPVGPACATPAARVTSDETARRSRLLSRLSDS